MEGISHNTVMLQSWTEAHRFRGDPIAFGTFSVIPISYGIPLKIAHMSGSSSRNIKPGCVTLVVEGLPKLLVDSGG